MKASITATSKPLWPKIVATVMLLAVPYVASWGPSLWFWTKLGQPEWMGVLLGIAYHPIFALVDGPMPIRGWLVEYGNWWIYLAH